MPTRPTLHVVFGMSAAGSLRQAFTLIGRDDRVIGLPDNLSFGPINPPEAKARARWVEEVLNYDPDWALGIDAFWDDAVSPNFRAVAWVCRRSASEYAGFLEWVWRQGDDECVAIDLTELILKSRPTDGASRVFRITGFGAVPAYQIIDRQLWDRQQILTLVERQEYRRQWETLRNENAPLRLIEADKLVSAPLTQFDPLILSCATNDWQKSARVIGETLGKSWKPYAQVDDLVLNARLWSLVDTGLLEARGDIGNLRMSEVRLARTTE